MTARHDDLEPDERAALTGLADQLASIRRRQAADPAIEVLAGARPEPSDQELTLDAVTSQRIWRRIEAGTSTERTTVATARMGLLGKAITDYVGIGNLKTYKVRFTKQTWPGEMLVSQVKVTGKREENGERLVDLEVTLANQEGEVKVAGEAVAIAA